MNLWDSTMMPGIANLDCFSNRFLYTIVQVTSHLLNRLDVLLKNIMKSVTWLLAAILVATDLGSCRTFTNPILHREAADP